MMMINAAANVNDRQNKRSRTDDASSVLAVISSELAQFLGVRSLLNFGATCKSHREVVAGEVLRRKACIMQIAVEVKRLLANQKQSVELNEYITRNGGSAVGFDEEGHAGIGLGMFRGQEDPRDNASCDGEIVLVSNPTRIDVIAAKKMLYQGIRFMDDEIYLLHKAVKSTSLATSSTQSYQQPQANVPEHPQVNSFLRSDQNTMTFSNLGHAQNFAKKHFGKGYNEVEYHSAIAEAGGVGKKAFVKIIKSAPGVYDAHQAAGGVSCASGWKGYQQAENCNIKIRQNLRAVQRKHLFQDEIGVLQSLNVLPDCFYFGLEGEFSTLSRGDIRKACRQVTKVYMSELSHQYVESYQVKLCGDVAHDLLRHGNVDGFRIASREYILDFQDLRNAFWCTVKTADAFIGGHDIDKSFDDNLDIYYHLWEGSCFEYSPATEGSSSDY